jgi:polar amino acid transport system substrate-binding protein
MKKRILFLSMFILFILFQSYGFTQQKIVISTGEWPPYTSQKMKHFGYSLHIISEAFKVQDYQVEYKFLPWKRAYVMAEQGKFDGTAVWYLNKKRKSEFYVSDSVSSSTTVLFHRKDKVVEWNTLEDLKKYKIGVTHGYTYGDKFNYAAKKYGFKLDSSPTDISGLKKLLKKRIDVMLSDLGVGYWILQNEFPSSQQALITNNPKIVLENTAHFFATKKSKDSPGKIEIINKGLKKLKETGQLDKFEDNLINGYYGN